MENGNAAKALEVRLVEWFDEHWYKIDRGPESPPDYFPSVTTKLGVVEKSFLARWRGDIGNREADMRLFEAQERGVRIHYAWWTVVTGGAVVFQPFKRPTFTEEQLAQIRDDNNGLLTIVKYQDEMYQLAKLKAFLNVVKPEIVAAELMVYSDFHREAGTIDNVFKIAEGEYPINGKKYVYLPGGFYVADLKTGSTFDDNAHMQSAAYANMYEERYDVPITGTLGIHTGSKNRTGIPGLGCHPRLRDEWRQDFDDFRNVSKLWERKHKEDRPETFEIPALITMKGDNSNEQGPSDVRPQQPEVH